MKSQQSHYLIITYYLDPKQMIPVGNYFDSSIEKWKYY